jgi:hypothetical protein
VADSSKRALELMVKVGDCLLNSVTVGVDAKEFRVLQIGNPLSQPEFSTSRRQGTVIY